MQITFLMGQEEQKVGAKGPYTVFNVTYKDQMGKPASKAFFTNSVPYKALKSAIQGQVFDVETVKNAKGYLDWVSVSPATGAPVQASTPFPTLNTDVGAAPAKSFTAGKTTSTYETPEERAKKQVYIVRQSSITAALTLLKDELQDLPVIDVLKVAAQFEEFVFNGLPAEAPVVAKKAPTTKKSTVVATANESFDELEEDPFEGVN